MFKFIDNDDGNTNLNVEDISILLIIDFRVCPPLVHTIYPEFDLSMHGGHLSKSKD